MTVTDTSVRVERHPGAAAISAAAYRLEVRSSPPRAILADLDGRIWSHLSLLASLDRTDVADESWAVGDPQVHEGEDGTVEVTLATRSSAWETKRVRLLCTPDGVELTATVTGSGTLATATLLGGRAVLANGACGWFRSSVEYASVFSPTPSEPVQVVRPAASGVVLGVLGDASPGRLHAVFSPPPLCLALGRVAADGATHVPDGGWLGLSVRAGVPELTFTELRYDVVDGGFRIDLDYDGHTRVDGTFTTPTLVLRPAADPWAVIADHRTDLVARGLAPAGPLHAPAPWWDEPIFCGWGAQCARAPLPGEPSSHPYHLHDLGPAVVPAGRAIGPDLARQDVYDELLGRLERHDVVPGTVVLDDRWQAEYGTNDPDPDRWPDLAGWIADRHARGQRVLLWWKAWDPAGIAPDECVLDPSGRPVSVDPGNPAYLRRVERIVTHLLGPAGLDADGFKIDFTQRAPAGRSLRGWTDARPEAPPVWGATALHALLGTIYRAAKAAKPDALVITHTPHPGFGDVCDMVRLNDVLERDPAARVVPVVDQLDFRAAVVRAAMPGHRVDTDQWPMPDREQWLAYVERQPSHGVPALYYAERIDRSGEEITAADLGVVARTWREYRSTLDGDRA